MEIKCLTYATNVSIRGKIFGLFRFMNLFKFFNNNLELSLWIFNQISLNIVIWSVFPMSDDRKY